jgi:cysteinyl-tRNA synthetase
MNKELVVYNTLTRTKEKFETLEPGIVKMYCCGPTVYDLLHVGNFRGAIFYNLLRNWLEHLGYKVKFVYNYTDVDDRIIERARKENVESSVVAEKYILEFQKDFQRLGLRTHSVNPKVTDTMDEIKNMVKELITNGKAYAVPSGDVLYSIRSFDGYGKLSNRNTEELKAGVRIDRDEQKRDPLDFALWKNSKPGEPTWNSDWGGGRPGWHIECSAMIKKHLGDQIDIHGGGMDLVFPHHENEIAQSEGASGHSLAKYWIHNNMINFSGTKMSKSLGNVVKARDFMEQFNPEILKYLMLGSHYRSVSDLGEAAIDQAIHALARIYSALAVAQDYLVLVTTAEKDPAFEKIIEEAWNGIETAMNDDFNTPEVMARIFEVVRQFNSKVKRGQKTSPKVVGMSQSLNQFVLKIGKMMALFEQPARSFLIDLDDMLLKKMNVARSDVQKIIEERIAVRAQKDFKKSDELRDQLTKMGIAVSDTAEGMFWEVIK